MSTIAQRTLNTHDWRMAGMGEYGALVKSAREQRGMTQDEVARQMGRPHTFLVRIEGGRNSNPPDPETMRAIWRTLGLSMRSQLIALGYLDPEEHEPGVAYVIREDDPRATLLSIFAKALRRETGADDGPIRSVTG
jgi:transcriptional regulator with XRE-family HTH domain